MMVSTRIWFNMREEPISAALYNPYSWALLAVLLFSAFTGWNRKYAKDEAPAA